jgi:hypothetical protein
MRNDDVTMLTSSIPHFQRPAQPESLCQGCGAGKRGDGVGGPYHPGCEPDGYMARLRQRAAQQPSGQTRTMPPDLSSPRQPRRRARLTPAGDSVTLTAEGAIINGLEVIYSPTFTEAGSEIGRRQRLHMMLAGLDGRAALDRALEEVHPACRAAYLGIAAPAAD